MAKFKAFVHTTNEDARAMTLAPWTYLSRLAKINVQNMFRLQGH